VPGSTRTVFIRPGTTDQDVYQGIFILGEYGTLQGNPRTIIDAGAHIGLASVYLATRFPDAEIVVIEPNDGNFAVLERNLGGRSNVRLHRGGLWSHKTTLEIENPADSGWEFRLRDGHGVEAFTVDELAARYSFNRIDLLKIDIEGAEVEVLSTAAAWISRVNTLAIELHDRFRPGCRAALDTAIRGQGFTEHSSGENIVLTRQAQAREAA
jgi:FkbM family methyltransferase